MFYYKEPSEVSENLFELYRYAGYPAKVLPPEQVVAMAGECVKEMKKVLVPKLVYEILDFQELDYIIAPSKNLSLNLRDCRKVLMFAATIGPQVDALIRKVQYIDAAKAGLMQACGAMFIESFVDDFNEEIKKQYTCRPRFSPGYGDVPLQVQKEFFKILPCQKIGLSLMESCLMAPEKSVSAFIGLL